MRAIFEILPIITFGIFFYRYDLIVATQAIILSSVSVAVFQYCIYKKIERKSLITNLILIIFGGITIMTNDTSFIKTKPTVIYMIFAIILTCNCYMKKNIMESFLGKNLSLSVSEWRIFNKSFAILFTVLSLLNEIIWRNFSETTWVNFKIFGMSFLTMLCFGSLLYKFRSKIQEK